MPKKKRSFMGKFGPWAFVLGLVIAAISALTKRFYTILSLLGIIVGLMNISEDELTEYLIASLTFLVSVSALYSTLAVLIKSVPFISNLSGYLYPLLGNITLFIAPGAAVVALKALYNLSKD